MIKHVVMWELKEFAEGHIKSENADLIKVGLERLKEEIKEIKFIEVGIDINKSEAAYDVILYSEFDKLEDLDKYQNHPSHLKISEFISKVRDKRIVVDYEV